jgi:hypothetical protein
MMTEADKKEIRTIVQDEILGILADAQESVGLKKDPTGMARKALEGLAGMIRQRQQSSSNAGK